MSGGRDPAPTGGPPPSGPGPAGPPGIRASQRWTVVFLLVLGLLVAFEKYLPGRESFARYAGEDTVLRFAMALVCFFLAVSFADRAIMRQHMLELLTAMRRLAGQLKQGGPTPDDRREAARILLGSLQSGDEKVRATAQTHLKRITGQDFGDDAVRWRAWIDKNL